jgi:hypothetical protein
MGMADQDRAMSSIRSFVASYALKDKFGMASSPKWIYSRANKWMRLELTYVFIQIGITEESEDSIEIQMLLDALGNRSIQWSGVNPTVKFSSNSVESYANHIRYMQKLAYILDVLHSLDGSFLSVECTASNDDCMDLAITVSFENNPFAFPISIEATVSPNGAELIYVKNIRKKTGRSPEANYSTIQDFVELVKNYNVCTYTRAAMLERVCDVMLRLSA